MAAARGALKKNATMLYTASQAFLRHPDVAATRANRDYVFKQVQEAIGGISSAAQASSPTDEKHGHAGIGELAAALNEFDVSQKVFQFFFVGLWVKSIQPWGICQQQKKDLKCLIGTNVIGNT